MTTFVGLITAFPTVIFTTLMVVVILYWLMVIVGAIDIDGLGGAEGATEGAMEGAAEGAMEGAAEGAMEGAAEGAMEGAAEGAMEGAAEGAMEGAAEGATEGAAEGATEGAAGGFAGLLVALHLRNAPLTITLSIVIFITWVLCVALGIALDGVTILPRWLLDTLVTAVALSTSIFLTAKITKPMRKVFYAPAGGATRKTMIGTVVVITTGSVNDRFGQALSQDGDAQLIQVRCDRDGLKKGDKALVVSFDKARNAFVVEPYADLLGR